MLSCWVHAAYGLSIPFMDERLFLIKGELQACKALSKQHLDSIFRKQRHGDSSKGTIAGKRLLQLALEVRL